MKIIFTLIFSLIAANSFGYYGPQYNTGANYNPTPYSTAYQYNPQTTVINHQNGQTTYIQQHGNSGTIRYSDGTVDYFRSR